MRKRASQRPERPLSPATRIAIAAGGSAAAAACCVVLLWSVSAGTGASFALVALPLIAMPVIVAATTWTAAHRAIAASLEPAIENLERMAGHDLSPPAAPFAGCETAGLGAALERCRAALEGRQRAGKVHAAVARFMGAAVSSLANGDLSRRVTLELPEPYRAFRDDFNASMERLETVSGTVTGSGIRLAAHQQEIDAAAAQLKRRAQKLAERIDAELEAIGNCDDREDLLEKVRHIMGGVAVAARRNIAAAERFSQLGLLVQHEATALADVGGVTPVSDPATAEGDEPAPRLPAATKLLRIHSAA